MSGDLAAFLLARIADEEAVARAAAVPYRDGETRPYWSVTLWDDYEGGLEILPSRTSAERDAEHAESLARRDRHEETDETRHIQLHDPARVLAECEAKRRIVAMGGSQCGDYEPPGSEFREDYEARARMFPETGAHWPDAYASHCDGCAAAESADRDHLQVLRLLALPYADHPDFRPEWRP